MISKYTTKEELERNLISLEKIIDKIEDDSNKKAGYKIMVFISEYILNLENKIHLNSKWEHETFGDD
jgi:hypothetical protein